MLNFTTEEMEILNGKADLETLSSLINEDVIETEAAIAAMSPQQHEIMERLGALHRHFAADVLAAKTPEERASLIREDRIRGWGWPHWGTIPMQYWTGMVSQWDTGRTKWVVDPDGATTLTRTVDGIVRVRVEVGPKGAVTSTMNNPSQEDLGRIIECLQAVTPWRDERMAKMAITGEYITSDSQASL